MYLFVLSGHLIGDYYLKYIPFMREKDAGILRIFIQALIYTLLITIIYSLFLPVDYVLFGGLTTLGIHFMIDLWHYLILKNQQGKPKEHQWRLGLFIGNLLLHFLFFYLLFELVDGRNLYIADGARKIIEMLLFIKPGDPLSIRIKYLFGYLFLITPSSYLMRYILQVIIPNEPRVESNRDNVGSMIGNIERIIVFTLGIMDLYASIALVITAKSLARFKQLEDRAFAERYLIGTLLSFLIALLSLLIILK